MFKIKDLRAFVIALPLILIVTLIDQVTKHQAVSHLCVFADPGSALFAEPTSCAHMGNVRLIDAPVQSAGRFPTFFPLIDLDFHLNRNAALSMPIPGPVWFEYVILLTIMALLAAWLWHEGGRHNAIGVGLILGGAIGNFIDRLVHGAVVDFLALHFGTFNAFVFNGADAAITLGVIWIFAEQSVLKRRRQSRAVVT